MSAIDPEQLLADAMTALLDQKILVVHSKNTAADCVLDTPSLHAASLRLQGLHPAQQTAPSTPNTGGSASSAPISGESCQQKIFPSMGVSIGTGEEQNKEEEKSIIIRTITGKSFSLKVNLTTTVISVKQSLEKLSRVDTHAHMVAPGFRVCDQRLVYGGRVLCPDTATLTDAAGGIPVHEGQIFYLLQRIHAENNAPSDPAIVSVTASGEASPVQVSSGPASVNEDEVRSGPSSKPEHPPYVMVRNNSLILRSQPHRAMILRIDPHTLSPDYNRRYEGSRLPPPLRRCGSSPSKADGSTSGTGESGGDEGNHTLRRGGLLYDEPGVGWYRFALNVHTEKYKDEDGKWGWLRVDGSPKEWAVCYHGTARHDEKGITQPDYFTDSNEGDGYRCGYVSTPYITEAERFGIKFESQGDKYKVVLQNRVNPKTVRWYTNQEGKRFYVTGDSDDIRPYGILIKSLAPTSTLTSPYGSFALASLPVGAAISGSSNASRQPSQSGQKISPAQQAQQQARKRCPRLVANHGGVPMTDDFCVIQ